MAEPRETRTVAVPSPTSTLDVTGLPCPIPVLKTEKALRAVPQGAILEVLASDPSSPADMTALCLATGHHLLSCETIQANAHLIYRFLIRKSEALPKG